MQSERIIRIMAGSLVLISLLFGAAASPFYHSAHWLWLATFVGFNLLQSGFTQFCPAETIMWKLGVKKCSNSSGNSDS